uniref:Uncharacterized protein n=1 Tax=Tanacetum cinerariifolium TaxID=118510 RepID=A0A699GSV1_TANCI|nr:hypothetical protein [Tanacetum cinerariifolium]
MPHPSRYFKIPKTPTEEMMREWMARKMKANERMKNQVVELENQINQGLRNCQAIIKNLGRQFSLQSSTMTTLILLFHSVALFYHQIKNPNNLPLFDDDKTNSVLVRTFLKAEKVEIMDLPE